MAKEQAKGDSQQFKAIATRLRAQHCYEVDEVPPSDLSEDIGGKCIMYSGMLRARRVYWAVCYGIAPEGTSKRCFMFQGSMYCE